MRNTKKFLSVLLAVLLIFSVAPLGGLEGVTASAASYEGTCGADGENVKWSFDDETGELKITGNGAIVGYAIYQHWSSYTDSIKTVTIEDGVTSIGDHAFYECNNLQSVKIGDSVTSIGYHAFSYCNNLQSVEIGNSVTSIGNDAFRSCDSLESITIPNSVTSIGDEAFFSCDSLQSVEIGSSVTSIGVEAFYNCDSLESITIPNSVTSIGENAFYDCDRLKSVEIGSGVTSIDLLVFAVCYSLESITVDEDNDCYSSDSNGVLYNKDKTTLIQYPIGNKRTSFVIPDSVTSIEPAAFAFCSSLERVKIPDSVTSIGSLAFAYCTGLKSATILNPECEIADVDEEPEEGLVTFPEGTIIHGYANSTAQQYAEKYGLQFTVHTADSETVIKDATCKEAGLKEHKCTFCGEIVSTEEIPTNGEHTPREAVKEKEIAATCSSAGSYDMVVYCDVCGEEISRVTYTTDKLPHTDNNDDGVCDECGNTIPVDTTGCDCVCHRVEKIPKIIYKILRAFWRLFKINKKCKCGTYHWIL